MSDLISREEVCRATGKRGRGMTLIDGDRIITAQLYDDEHEEFTEKRMSIIDYINAYTDEGVTEADVVERIDVPYTNVGELISRQAAFDEIIWNSDNGVIDAKVAIEALRKLPSVEPERKKGHWIMQNDKSKKLLGWLFCSECNAWIGEPTDYCSNCGADMREVQDECKAESKEAEERK